MLHLPGKLIGDAWFYPEGDVVHAFFLTCDDHLERHEHWDIGHAVSRDLVTWSDLGIALAKGGTDDWDHNLATGSILRRGGRYWMAYTGHSNAQIGMASSDDLHHWQRCDGNPVTSLDRRFYESVGSGHRPMIHWRDPCLFEHEGYVYHYVCASRDAGPADRRGTLGLARTSDLRHWTVLPPPDVEVFCEELECPQLVRRGEMCYLLFSSQPQFFPEDVRSRLPEVAAVSATYCMIADSPLGPFRFASTGPILPIDRPNQPYACQVVEHQGRDYLLGTLHDDGGTLSDPIEVRFDATGCRAI